MGRDGTGTGGTVVAVVLAGGAGRRMDGADKAALELDGATFLDRVLRAAAGVAGRLVVVGPPRPVALERAVIFVQEASPGGARFRQWRRPWKQPAGRASCWCWPSTCRC